MKFYNLCKAALWLAALWASVAVALLSSMLAWKIGKWWNAF